MSKKTVEQPARRRGPKPMVAGAPATSPVTIKLSEEQKAKLQQLGGAPWVRDKIDKAKVPTPKE